MKKIYSFFLLTCLLLIGTNAWADEVTIASFSHDAHEGWTITSADYATASGGYYKLISSDAAIVSPAATWSDYTNITITITARKFGGPDATQGKISVVQGNNELTSYSPSSTSCVASSELSISPAEGAITIACLGASSSKGCGVQSVVIKGTPAGDTPPTIYYTVTYDCDGASNCPENQVGITAGSSITLPAAPEKDGFTFAGWSDGTTTYAASASYTVNSNVTMTAQWTANTPAGDYEWVLASLEDLTGSDVFVIVGTMSNNNYALPSDNGASSAPATVSINIENNKITESLVADKLQWNVSGNATNGYTFYPNGSTTTWLYCNTSSASGSNNNIRVGSGNRKVFELNVDNYLITKDENVTRYLSIYNSADWRGYVNENLCPAISFYKKVAIDPSDPSVATAITINATGITSTDVYEGTAAGSLSAVVKAGETTIDGAVVTWTSSDENVATINENTGAVTLVAAGTTTITANYAGVENQYKPSTKTYVLTVTNSTPVVYSTISDLFAAATTTEQTVQVAFNNWVVSGVSTNGKNVFVTDGTNGFVIYSNSDVSATYPVNSILSGTISCTLKKYNGFAELLSVSGLTITEGGVVAEANVAMADLAGVNTGALLHYEGLTCSVDNNKYYLSDGTTTIQVYNSLFAFDALEDGKTYNITGVYQQYNSTKEILPRSADDIEEVVILTPSIDVEETSINVPYTGTLGETVNVTFENITTIVAEVVFFEADGQTQISQQDEPDWIAADIDDQTHNLVYVVDANDGAARTAYMKVYALDDESNDVYSDLITLSQASAPLPTTDYVIVHNDAEIVSGAHYIIASGVDGTVKIMDEQKTSNRGALTVTADNGVIGIEEGTEIHEFVICKDGDYYVIYDGGYLYAASSSANQLKTQINNNANGKWSISIDDQIASIVATESSNRNVIRYNYNGGNSLFSCYETAETQAEVYLYIKADEDFAMESVEISSAGYATMYYSSKNLIVPEDVTAAYVFNTTDGLEAAYAPGEVIPQGTGVVLEGAAGTYNFVETVVPGTAPATGKNQLKGSDVAATTTGGDVYYALSLNADGEDVGFYYMEEGGAAFTNGAHKAYLALAASQAPARFYIFNGATNINNIEDVDDAVKFMENGKLFIKKNGVIYNAVGAKVK